MHFVVFGSVLVILSAALSAAIGLAIHKVTHFTFLGMPLYHFGVWTLPNALMMDLVSIAMTITMTFWPLVSSLFIVSLKGASVFSVSTYQLPEWAHTVSKDMAYTLYHKPIFGVNGKRISMRAAKLMSAKALMVGFVVFAFVVMPTCTVVTVIREQHLSSLGLDKPPTSCAAMFPAQAVYWTPFDEKFPRVLDESDFASQVFESLCWTDQYAALFTAVWSASVGAGIALVSYTTAVLQYGERPDKSN